MLPDLTKFSPTQQIILTSTFNNVPLASILSALSISTSEFDLLRKSSPSFDEAFRCILLYNLNQHHSTLKNSASLGDVKSITTLLDRSSPATTQQQQSSRDFLSQALREARELDTPTQAPA